MPLMQLAEKFDVFLRGFAFDLKLWSVARIENRWRYREYAIFVVATRARRAKSDEFVQYTNVVGTLRDDISNSH